MKQHGLTGKKKTEEHRRKMSEAAKARWQRIREAQEPTRDDIEAVRRLVPHFADLLGINREDFMAKFEQLVEARWKF